jgi:hypothetical protein
MEAICSSETLVSTDKSTRRYCSEDQHRHRHSSNLLTNVFFEVVNCAWFARVDQARQTRGPLRCFIRTDSVLEL